MTDSFNISISSEDIIARLIAAERNNESLTAYIQRVETYFTRALNRLSDDFTEYTEGNGGRLVSLEQRLDRLEPLMQDCIDEALAAGEKADLLNDRVKDYTLALREMTRKPNAPKPPVDTSWHPYYAEVDGPDGVHPTELTRVVVMERGGEITGPHNAGNCYWDECGDETIVAWRYAKEGE